MADAQKSVYFDHEALDRFVVENDELTELETQIGRLNVFDVLRIAGAEIRHSNFLRWLLDPAESHGQGDLFIKAVLMDLLRLSPRLLRPISPVELDAAQLRGVVVQRETGRIDILVTCKEPPVAIAIENKVGSGEHGDQLGRYEQEVAERHPGLRPLFVFLTKDRTTPSRERWLPYGYADLHRVLDRCRQVNAASIGGDVRVFLDHYLSLIGSRFMDNKTIDELCQQIFRKHRRALRLIYDRMGAPNAGIIGDFQDLLERQPDRWHITHRYGTQGGMELGFVPRSWLDLFPAIAAKYDSADARAWFRLGFWSGPLKGENVVRFWCHAYPTTDPATRRLALERLTKDKDEFSLRPATRNLTEKHTKLCGKTVASWPEDEEPNVEAVVTEAAKKLDQVWQQFSGVPAALSPIFKTAIPAGKKPADGG